MNVLITGATSGIGFALTEKLIKNGHKVFLGVRTKNEVKTTLEKVKEIDYQDRVTVLKLDITKKDDRDIIKSLDVDCLVNQAGIGIGGSLLNMKISDIRKNFEVNFFGTLEMTKLYIESRKNKSGKVLITSSLAGLLPIPFLGSYCSTKSALITMATCLKKEIKKTNLDIKIKLIEPGAYKTGFNQIMIESNNILDGEMFNQSLESISKTIEDKFSLVEKKNISRIVNKMYKAIESDSNKLVYRSPFIQVLGAKLYMMFFK